MTTHPDIVCPLDARISGTPGSTYPYEDMAMMVVDAVAGRFARAVAETYDPAAAQRHLDDLITDFRASAALSDQHAAFVEAVLGIAAHADPTSPPDADSEKKAVMGAFDQAFRPDLPTRTECGPKDPLGLRR